MTPAEAFLDPAARARVRLVGLARSLSFPESNEPDPGQVLPLEGGLLEGLEVLVPEGVGDLVQVTATATLMFPPQFAKPLVVYGLGLALDGQLLDICGLPAPLPLDVDTPVLVVPFILNLVRGSP